MPDQFIINGQIKQLHGKELSGVIVKAFDKDLPSLKARGLDEQPLGDGITDAEGRYRIAFTADQFNRGEARTRRKLRPDLIIRVYDGDLLLGESTVQYNAPDEATIDLTVTLPHRSEYEKLIYEITPVLQSVAIADLTDEDIVFLTRDTGIGEGSSPFLSRLAQLLNNKTGMDTDLLALLRKAAQFARQSNVAPEACYAWVRLLNPADLDHLVSTSAGDLRKTLQKAIAEDLVPASLEDKIDALIRSLKRYNYTSYQAVGQLVEEGTGAPVIILF